MHCHICDAVDDNITQDPRDGSWTPCSFCQEVINDTVGSYGSDDELDPYVWLDE